VTIVETGAAELGGGFSSAPVIAATSRATPSRQRQSARFGVSFSVEAVVEVERSAEVGAGRKRRVEGEQP
jgi:hypothetical protein